MEIKPTVRWTSAEDLESALAKAQTDVPALSELLKAFGSVLVERARLRETAAGWTGPPPIFDPERYSAGVHLLSEASFLDMSPSLPQAAASMLAVMRRSFPSLTNDFDALSQGMERGDLTPEVVAAGAFDSRIVYPAMSPEVFSFVATEVVRPFVERQATDLVQFVRDLPWRESCCPICGSAPGMSVMRRSFDPSEYIQAHGGRRWLRCSFCSVEWSYKRVSCPTCGCEEPDELVVFCDPSKPFERVDACRRCSSFVLCLDAGELAQVPDADLSGLLMSALEARACREGFTPISKHPWSELLM